MVRRNTDIAGTQGWQDAVTAGRAGAVACLGSVVTSQDWRRVCLVSPDVAFTLSISIGRLPGTSTRRSFSDTDTRTVFGEGDMPKCAPLRW